MAEKITVNFEGKERELFMSYGLLNELAKIVGDPQIAPAISVNENLRAEVLAACLAERKNSGKVVKPIEDPDDLDITLDDAERLLDWATENVLSFFVRSLGKMVQRLEANKETLEGLKSSLGGLEASPSETA